MEKNQFLGLRWNRVTRAMCESGNPVRGKNLYFSKDCFGTFLDTLFYPLAADGNNGKNLGSYSLLGAPRHTQDPS